MLLVAVAAVTIWPAFTDGPLHPGERVRFVARRGADWIATVDRYEACKEKEAFFARRTVTFDDPGGPTLPSGTPIVGIRPGSVGYVIEVREPGGPHNDGPEARVRVATGGDAGRRVWVSPGALEPVRPPTPRERREQELRRTLELRRRRR